MTAPDLNLKPCPFCGGLAYIVTGEECAYVQCEDVKMHRALWFDGDNAASDAVAEQWNRREERNPRVPWHVTPGVMGDYRDPAVLAADPLVQALIGAVVEEAAKVAMDDHTALQMQASLADNEGFDTVADFDRERADTAMQIYHCIRALRPDATAAFQRALREARNEGLEKAAAKLHWLWDADGTVTERRVAVESAAAILALKEQPE